jgi:hypothetical protein
MSLATPTVTNMAASMLAVAANFGKVVAPWRRRVSRRRIPRP